MGCVFSHRGDGHNDTDSPAVTAANAEQLKNAKALRKFSWDKREKVILKDFTIDGVKGETICKLPGTVNGQQYSIENCQDCNIYIFDNGGAVSIENCTNCRIFLGPVRSSVYLRDCADCSIGVICRQFRARGCKKVEVFLCCTTPPNIESSTGMTFACLQYHYTKLKDQFHEAQFSVYNNYWGNVHDGSPAKPSKNLANFRLLNECARADQLIPKNDAGCEELDVSSDPEKSVMPFVPPPNKAAPKDKSCLVMFFSDGLSHERAHTFIKQMKNCHPDCCLVQSREVYMAEEDAEKVFGTESYAMAVRQGPVIGLEYIGAQSCHLCQEMLIAISKGSTGLVFVSSNHDSAARQIDSFFRFAELNVSNFTPQRVSSVRR